MTVIEGHAEHVMDAAASDFVPGVEDAAPPARGAAVSARAARD